MAPGAIVSFQDDLKYDGGPPVFQLLDGLGAVTAPAIMREKRKAVGASMGVSTEEPYSKGCPSIAPDRADSGCP